MANSSVFLTILTFCFFCITFAFEAQQDFCVADFSSTVRVNGLPCKDPAKVTADDFFYSGLNKPANTSNIYGANVVLAGVAELPGLNTLGISMSRADLLPKGVFPPHVHPRATEILTLTEGSLVVGFISTAPAYNNYNKTLQVGDVFVVPPGLVHYVYNVGNVNAVAIVAWNSPDIGGVSLLPKAVFGPKPLLDADFLAKSFLLEKNVVADLQAKFGA